MQTGAGIEHESREWITLRATARSSWLEHVARRWTANVVGQPQATESIFACFSALRHRQGSRAAPWGPPCCSGRPAAARHIPSKPWRKCLLGSPSALLKINCAEYQQQHEIARLVGAPPGYIGHADTEPVFTRENH